MHPSAPARLIGVIAVVLLTGGASARAASQVTQIGPVAASVPATATSAPVGAFGPPVTGDLTVVNAFHAPPGRFAAGHRGVDLATPPGEQIVAAGAGRVTFAGSVAGRGVVVIAHAAGVSTEYEPLRPAVGLGEVVASGQTIGWVAGTHLSCAAERCLHWGARRAGAYFDPLSLLHELGPVRLLPWH
jgi:murein DD-endopeptidase MepM/ murein hydrolase activator NlpD